MDMIRATILEANINDIFCPEVVLVMTHVKNLRSTQALDDSKSPIKKQNNTLSILDLLRIISSYLYIFLYEE